jgi:anti-anti-sigma factor
MTIEEAVNGNVMIPASSSPSPTEEDGTTSEAMGQAVVLSLRLVEAGAPGLSGEAAVLRLNGDLDASSARFVKERLQTLVQTFERVHLILDLPGLTFIDSHGLAVLFEAKRRVTERGGMLVLIGLRGQPYRVFGSILDDGFFVSVATVAEARNAIKAARIGAATDTVAG